MKTDNELIAEFMGAIYDSEAGTYNFSPKENFSPENLKYSSSWDWLMPVVEKISLHIYESKEEDNGIEKRMIHDRAYPRTFGMMSDDGKWLFRFNRMPVEDGETLIQAACNSVIEFIKWYNKQNKQ